jgi:hypothetical protein
VVVIVCGDDDDNANGDKTGESITSRLLSFKGLGKGFKLLGILYSESS